MAGMKILYLHLRKIWFDQIASGEKTKEYRLQKPYWHKRLEGKHYGRNARQPSSARCDQ